MITDINKEDKELLLKDLCARLPYGVKVFIQDITGNYSDILERTLDTYVLQFFRNNNILIKPYLRLMSSMTKEEKELYMSFKRDIMYQGFCDIELYMNRYIKWLDFKHFDWRTNGNGKTLIELDLALEAPEGMYDLKKK